MDILRFVMTTRRHLLALVAIGCVCVAASPGAQTQPPRSVYDRYTEPIQIFKTGLGTFSRPTSSANKEAQAFFDQGFQMMYSFAKPEAVRSFREAWKRDPDCAICYWGEAWAWGSYLNAPMNAEESPHAYAAVQRVRRSTRRVNMDNPFEDLKRRRNLTKPEPNVQWGY
jgi:hypothetical protein